MTKQQNIVKRQIIPVARWNNEKRSQGKYILVYTLGNGSMVDQPRQRGYVVQKYHKEGGERSKYHKNYSLALSDFYQDNF